MSIFHLERRRKIDKAVRQQPRCCFRCLSRVEEDRLCPWTCSLRRQHTWVRLMVHISDFRPALLVCLLWNILDYPGFPRKLISKHKLTLAKSWSHSLSQCKWPPSPTSCHPKIKVHFLCLIILVWPLSVSVPKMGAKKKLTCKAPIHCLLLAPKSELYNSFTPLNSTFWANCSLFFSS